MEPIKPFKFKQCVCVLKSAAKKASDLSELRDAIAGVSDNSIFHHTCHYFLKAHVFEHTNDFARWCGESLKENALAERLSNIDPYAFKSIAELRSELLSIINEHLGAFPQTRKALSGDEFHFNTAITLIFPSEVEVKNLAEFLTALRYIDISSVYYHFHEARMRLNGIDDFSNWFENELGEKTLADKIRATDLFMRNIGETRDYLAAVIEEEVKEDIEKLG